jgi:signal transduction histidine kinase
MTMSIMATILGGVALGWCGRSRRRRERRQLLASLSHELRTPLNAIIGWVNLLKSGAVDEPTRNRALDSIDRNARREASLVDQLLETSAALHGEPPLARAGKVFHLAAASHQPI